MKVRSHPDMKVWYKLLDHLYIYEFFLTPMPILLVYSLSPYCPVGDCKEILDWMHTFRSCCFALRMILTIVKISFESLSSFTKCTTFLLTLTQTLNSCSSKYLALDLFLYSWAQDKHDVVGNNHYIPEIPKLKTPLQTELYSVNISEELHCLLNKTKKVVDSYK